MSFNMKNTILGHVIIIFLLGKQYSPVKSFSSVLVFWLHTKQNMFEQSAICFCSVPFNRHIHAPTKTNTTRQSQNKTISSQNKRRNDLWQRSIQRNSHRPCGLCPIPISTSAKLSEAAGNPATVKHKLNNGGGPFPGAAGPQCWFSRLIKARPRDNQTIFMRW